jgi:hypothetical protein
MPDLSGTVDFVAAAAIYSLGLIGLVGCLLKTVQALSAGRAPERKSQKPNFSPN